VPFDQLNASNENIEVLPQQQRVKHSQCVKQQCDRTRIPRGGGKKRKRADQRN
jgi:hypothetical protein